MDPRRKLLRAVGRRVRLAGFDMNKANLAASVAMAAYQTGRGIYDEQQAADAAEKQATAAATAQRFRAAADAAWDRAEAERDEDGPFHVDARIQERKAQKYESEAGIDSPVRPRPKVPAKNSLRRPRTWAQRIAPVVAFFADGLTGGLATALASLVPSTTKRRGR